MAVGPNGGAQHARTIENESDRTERDLDALGGNLRRIGPPPTRGHSSAKRRQISISDKLPTSGVGRENQDNFG